MSGIDASNSGSNLFQLLLVEFKTTFVIVKQMGIIILYWV